MAARLGEGPDRGERALEPALRRLVRDDVEHGVAVRRLLDEPGDRDALRRELLGESREHTGPVLDLQTQVPR